MKHINIKHIKYISIFLIFLLGCGGDDNDKDKISINPSSSEYDNGFVFFPDNSRLNKVYGIYEFELLNISKSRYIRDLKKTDMKFRDRPFGSDTAFRENEEDTSTTEIETKSITVNFLLDVSFSIVEAGVDRDLITLSNQFSQNVNSNNRSQPTIFRTFGGTVSQPNRSFDINPFRNLQFEGQGNGTALYDAISLGISDMEIYNSKLTEKIIFVFTDGRDTASSIGSTPSSEVLNELIINPAKNDNIQIYIIGLGDVDRERLNQISLDTGGSFFLAKNKDNLSDVFDDLLHSIPVTYTVRYNPTYQSTGHFEFQFEINYDGSKESFTDSFNLDAILQSSEN